MTEDRTCKRCSVDRVNALCKAYGRAHKPGGRMVRRGLAALVMLAGERGCQEGDQLLAPGLDAQSLRQVCWNTSSFLQDEDLKLHLADL